MSNEKREQQMMVAARDHGLSVMDDFYTDTELTKAINDFCAGWRTADFHPQWYDAQGDTVPEYGREVIVIGCNGKVFYGHRPNPEEITMVEGKPYHAKTYGKNGWNWDNIALWLDVEIPHKLIDKIVTAYFKEKQIIPEKKRILMLDFKQFNHDWKARDFINNVLNGEYETITEGVGGYTVWYRKNEQD